LSEVKKVGYALVSEA